MQPTDDRHVDISVTLRGDPPVKPEGQSRARNLLKEPYLAI
jgi:hypothetical protein